MCSYLYASQIRSCEFSRTVRDLSSPERDRYSNYASDRSDSLTSPPSPTGSRSITMGYEWIGGFELYFVGNGMHEWNQRIHGAIHQEEKPLFVKLTADRDVLFDLGMSQPTRFHRLIKEIGDSVTRIAVIVVNVRLDAQIHADIHELSLRRRRIPTLLAICWSTESLRTLPQMSESAVGISGVEIRKREILDNARLGSST